METASTQSVGFLSLVLHAHQPYVLHHGTWPHGLEWLLEAASETYLPLLRTIRRLEADGIRFSANVSLSPVLLEQLAHADFRAELPKYLQRKIVSAREDAAFFQQAEEFHLLSLARHWEVVFQEALDDLDSLDGNLIAGFRQAEQSGSIGLLTTAATHGYAPLLGTDGSLRAQFQTAVSAHQRHLGKQPRGVWLPECGYRPSGPWRFPVMPEGAPEQGSQDRIGVERALSEAGLRFTFVDSHLVEDGQPVDSTAVRWSTEHAHSLYRPHTVSDSGVVAFARDPRSAFQVWSSHFGYPGDFAYLDFHKKRWPGGHRYWRVTGENLGMADKEPYYPDAARERSRTHARHFAALVAETLRANGGHESSPPILCAPFDLELFGHWWHEGMQFLEDVARVLATGENGVQPLSCGDYLEMYGSAGALRLHEGSWGAGGDSSVWLNGETGPLLSRMYGAELQLRAATQHPAWTDGGTGERIATQLCRELLLMESSDWPTLITTGAARDYAERRFAEHAESFAAVLEVWECFLSGAVDQTVVEESLAPLEARDGIFPYLNPASWRESANRNGE